MTVSNPRDLTTGNLPPSLVETAAKGVWDHRLALGFADYELWHHESPLVRSAVRAEVSAGLEAIGLAELLAALQNVRAAHLSGHNESEAWGWVDAAISKATSK
jgi:hypothetical protein